MSRQNKQSFINYPLMFLKHSTVGCYCNYNIIFIIIIVIILYYKYEPIFCNGLLSIVFNPGHNPVGLVFQRGFRLSLLTVPEDAIESFMSLVGGAHGVDAHPEDVIPSSLSSAFFPSVPVSFHGTLRYFLRLLNFFLHLPWNCCSRSFQEISDVIDLRGSFFSVGRRLFLRQVFIESFSGLFQIVRSFPIFLLREEEADMEDAGAAQVLGQGSSEHLEDVFVVDVIVRWAGLLLFFIWGPEAVKTSVSRILKEFY